MSTGICRGCGEIRELIRAHIIPAGFARDILDGGQNKHNLLVSKDNVYIQQHGVYDQKILCADCDRILGNLDNYALGVGRRFSKEHRIWRYDSRFYELPKVDGDRLATFVLSLLWRASISTRPECADVALGPYEPIARDVVLGKSPLTDLPFELLMCRYHAVPGFDPTHHYTYPFPSKMDGLRVWRFGLHGFGFIAKLDKRAFESSLRLAVVNGSTTLIGMFIGLEETPEGRALRKIALDHERRRNGDRTDPVSRSTRNR